MKAAIKIQNSSSTVCQNWFEWKSPSFIRTTAHCSEIQYKDGQGLNSFWQSNFGAKLNLKGFDLYFKPLRNCIYKWSTMRSSLKAQETTFMVITEQRPLWTNLTKWGLGSYYWTWNDLILTIFDLDLILILSRSFPDLSLMQKCKICFNVKNWW